MSKVVSTVDAVVLKVEQYALVLVGAALAASSEVDPSRLPHREAAWLLAGIAGLTAVKPYLTKAVTVTQAFTTGGGEKTITSLVDRATGDVKHVVTHGEDAVKAVVADVKGDEAQVKTLVQDEVTVAKDEIHTVPAGVTEDEQAKATADAAAARADLEKQAAEAKATLATVEAALNANPPTPAGPSA